MKTLHYFIIAIVGITISVIGNSNLVFAQYGGGPMIESYTNLSQILASGNNVYLLWSDYNSHEKTYLMLFRASNDAGNSFGNIISIGNSFTGSNFSQMASHGDNLYIALGNMIKKSSDGGHTFEDKIPFSTGTAGISNIIATENHVYLTADDILNSGNSFEILFVSSKDNGTTFSKPVKLFGMPESSQDYLQMAASGTNVYVVGEGKYGGIQGPVGVLYRASRDGGATFSDTVDLSGNDSIDYAPKVTTSGNYVYVAWSELASDHKNTDLIFRVSSDGGETFGPKIKLNQEKNVQDTYNTDFIQLFAYEMLVYVKWWDVHFLPNGTETDHLLFKRMPLGDATIGKTIELTGSNARPIDIGHNSIITVGGNNVYALWSEYSHLPSSQQSIFLRVSQDGGFSFGDATDLNMQNNLSGKNSMTDAQISTYGNNLYVAGDVTSPALGILFGTSTDNGKTFGNITNLDAQVIPEFPFAQIILVSSIASVIVFYRMRFKK